MGRRGQEGIATEGEQIEKGPTRKRSILLVVVYTLKERRLIQLLSLRPIRSPKTSHLTVERLHL